MPLCSPERALLFSAICRRLFPRSHNTFVKSSFVSYVPFATDHEPWKSACFCRPNVLQQYHSTDSHRSWDLDQRILGAMLCLEKWMFLPLPPPRSRRQLLCRAVNTATRQSVCSCGVHCRLACNAARRWSMPPFLLLACLTSSATQPRVSNVLGFFRFGDNENEWKQ